LGRCIFVLAGRFFVKAPLPYSPVFPGPRAEPPLSPPAKLGRPPLGRRSGLLSRVSGSLWEFCIPLVPSGPPFLPLEKRDSLWVLFTSPFRPFLSFFLIFFFFFTWRNVFFLPRPRTAPFFFPTRDTHFRGVSEHAFFSPKRLRLPPSARDVFEASPPLILTHFLRFQPLGHCLFSGHSQAADRGQSSFQKPFHLLDTCPPGHATLLLLEPNTIFELARPFPPALLWCLTLFHGGMAVSLFSRATCAPPLYAPLGLPSPLISGSRALSFEPRPFLVFSLLFSPSWTVPFLLSGRKGPFFPLRACVRPWGPAVSPSGAMKEVHFFSKISYGSLLGDCSLAYPPPGGFFCVLSHISIFSLPSREKESFFSPPARPRGDVSAVPAVALLFWQRGILPFPFFPINRPKGSRGMERPFFRSPSAPCSSGCFFFFCPGFSYEGVFFPLFPRLVARGLFFFTMSGICPSWLLADTLPPSLSVAGEIFPFSLLPAEFPFVGPCPLPSFRGPEGFFSLQESAPSRVRGHRASCLFCRPPEVSLFCWE